MTEAARTMFFIVPAFNEAGNATTLVGGFRALDAELRQLSLTPHFIIVDDGSSDDTVKAFTAASVGLPLEILSHGRNRGPGMAFATGFTHLQGRIGDGAWLVTMEGDNTSRHELISQMLTRTREGYDLVLASPYMYGGTVINTAFIRTFLSYCANIFMRELLELRGILTMSSFFRLYRGATVRQLQAIYGAGIIERPGFDCMVELLMKAVFLSVRLSEVPMVLDTSRRVGKSKMKVMRAIYDLLTLTFQKARWKAMARQAPGRASVSRAG